MDNPTKDEEGRKSREAGQPWQGEFDLLLKIYHHTVTIGNAHDCREHYTLLLGDEREL